MSKRKADAITADVGSSSANPPPPPEKDQETAETAGAPVAAPPSHLERAMLGIHKRDMFRKVESVGEGTYGKVYKCIDRRTNETVALKRVRMSVGDKEGFPVTALREIAVLSDLQHENIVALRSVVVGDTPDSIYLVFDFCRNDLSSISGTLDVSVVKSLLLQMLKGVAYMHSKLVIHRDLKLSNVLLHNGVVKIADFGLARLCEPGPTHDYTVKVVTLWYRAPELLMRQPRYTTAVDMWAVGCMFAEMMRGDPLMCGASEGEQLDLICNVTGKPRNRDLWGHAAPGMCKVIEGHSHANKFREHVPGLTKAGEDLLSSMLDWDPTKRITAREALKHPYFREAPLPQSPELIPNFFDARPGRMAARKARQ